MPFQRPLWDTVTCDVYFTDKGLNLDFGRSNPFLEAGGFIPRMMPTSTLMDRVKLDVAHSAKMIKAAKLPKTAAKVMAPRVSGASATVTTKKFKAAADVVADFTVMSRYTASVLPLFQGHKYTLSHERVTQIRFRSKDTEWRFCDEGFRVKEKFRQAYPGVEKHFVTQAPSDYEVETQFIPQVQAPNYAGLLGFQVPYELVMRTETYDKDVYCGRSTIIIDPIFETGEVHE